jgi:hypothetical protein
LTAKSAIDGNNQFAIPTVAGLKLGIFFYHAIDLLTDSLKLCSNLSLDA